MGGGKLVIIIDEGLLNIDDYSHLRVFIKTHFYIKAVISLTTDTFIPVSKTPTKTSILYLVKKDDPDVIQQEPIFFAYVDKVGLNTRRKVCDNHLFSDLNKNAAIEFYNQFKEKILSCYKGMNFDKNKLHNIIETGKSFQIDGNSYYYIRKFKEIEDRLDFRYYDPQYDKIKEFMRSNSVMRLGDIILLNGTDYGLTASGLEIGAIPFVNIENLTDDGIINHENLRYVNNVTNNLLLKQDELLISRSRLIGLSSIVRKSEEGFTYGSYIIRFKLNTNKIEPLFISRFINSTKGRLQTELLKTGSVGENINIEQLLQIAIPDINKRKQIEILKEVEKYDNQYKEKVKEAEQYKNTVRNIIEAVKKN